MNDDFETRQLRIRLKLELLGMVENEQDAMDLIEAGLLGLKWEGVFEDDLDALIGDAKQVATKYANFFETVDGVAIG